MEIRYREKLFGMLTSNVDDIFVMFSADDFTVEYVSPNIERLLGVGMEEVKKDLRVLNAAIVDKTTIASKDVLRGIVMGESWKTENSSIYGQENSIGIIRRYIIHRSEIRINLFGFFPTGRKSVRRTNSCSRRWISRRGRIRRRATFLRICPMICGLP